MLRFSPAFAIAVLIGPLICGMLATLLPAFGYFPALGGNTLSLQPFRDVFAAPGIERSIGISLASGVVTAAISIIFVMLFFAAWSGTRLFSSAQHLLSPLLSIPHAAAAFGLAFMIMPSGWIMRLISPELTGFSRPPDWIIIHDPWAISMMAGLIAKEIPFLFLVALAALPQAKPVQYSRITTGLGFGRIAGFLFGVWPLVYRQIRLAVFAVIAYSSSVVDVALILGPTNPPPLAVQLVRWMSDPDLGLRFTASAGALVQLGVTATALLIWLLLERLGGLTIGFFAYRGFRFRRDKLARGITAAGMIAPAAAVIAGLVILALWSVSGFWGFPDALPESYTLRTWNRQLGAIAEPFHNTWITGAIVTLIAVAITLSCLEREAQRRADRARTPVTRALAIVYLPLIVPQASFVFGLQLFFLWTGFNGTFSALLLVHLVFVLPYVFLSLSDPWRALDPRFSLTAASLGAGRARIFWRVKVPMLLRAILTAAAIGFAVSIGQYLPTLLIGAGRWPTLTTEAVALASGGDRRVIGVYAFLQMVLPFAGFLVAGLIPLLLFSNRRGLHAST